MLFACHQCHFALRQLEKDTHRQKLLAAGAGYGKTNNASWEFYKGKGPAKPKHTKESTGIV